MTIKRSSRRASSRSASRLQTQPTGPLHVVDNYRTTRIPWVVYFFCTIFGCINRTVAQIPPPTRSWPINIDSTSLPNGPFKRKIQILAIYPHCGEHVGIHVVAVAAPFIYAANDGVKLIEARITAATPLLAGEYLFPPNDPFGINIGILSELFRIIVLRWHPRNGLGDTYPLRHRWLHESYCTRFAVANLLVARIFFFLSKRSNLEEIRNSRNNSNVHSTFGTT